MTRPIRNDLLPPELLEAMFTRFIFLGNQPFTKDFYNLTRVCRNWSVVARRLEFLWLDLDRETVCLSLLQHANAIRWPDGTLPRDGPKRVFLESVFDSPAVNLDQLEALFGLFRETVSHLSLACNVGSTSTGTLSGFLIARPPGVYFPLLRKLEIDKGLIPEDSKAALLAIDPKNLRYLRLKPLQSVEGLQSLELTKLDSLILSDAQCGPHDSTFPLLLEASPNLRWLELRIDDGDMKWFLQSLRSEAPKSLQCVEVSVQLGRQLLRRIEEDDCAAMKAYKRWKGNKWDGWAVLRLMLSSWTWLVPLKGAFGANEWRPM